MKRRTVKKAFAAVLAGTMSACLWQDAAAEPAEAQEAAQDPLTAEVLMEIQNFV